MLHLDVSLSNHPPAVRGKHLDNLKAPEKPSSKQSDNEDNWICGPLQIGQIKIC